MIPLRSWLFVPGDSERKLAKVATTAADALILDLEDAVVPERKSVARQTVHDFLAAHPPEQRRSELWVRINPLDLPLALADLVAIMPGKPDGIVLPKAAGPTDVLRLSHYLEAFEAAHGYGRHLARILPVATETPQAPFRLGDYADAGLPRLHGLTWGAEDLSAALGAVDNVGPDGRWTLTYRTVRAWTLLAAHAAGVEAVETLFVDIQDQAGLAESCRMACDEGFTGRIAIHPDQVDIINASFTPAPAEVDQARRVIAAFASAENAGAIALDGKMLDIPHLRRAERLLARAAAYASKVAHD